MGLLKLILLFSVFWFVFRYFRKIFRRSMVSFFDQLQKQVDPMGASRRKFDQPKTQEQLVACANCGVYVPQSELTIKDSLSYCSASCSNK